jgi:uncharacterized protein
MPISMHQASVPVFAQILSSLSGILQKAAAHAEAKKIDPAILLSARLYPDMFHLTRQVQIVTDHAKGACARLAGRDVPSYPDTEASFSELQARLQKTLDYVHSFQPADIEGSEDREFTLTIGGQKIPFQGQPYLLHFVLPNLFFHAATAYDILREQGVELGKRDFIGRS